MAKKKAEDIKLTLTDEEREGLDNEGIKRVLTSKAILKVAKEYKFSDEEKEEFEARGVRRPVYRQKNLGIGSHTQCLRHELEDHERVHHLIKSG